MGTTYFGPYFEEINTYKHEGYAARVMPDGTETSTFGGAHGWTGHTGYRARYDCGWTGTPVYPVPDPDPLECDEADEEWMREHIQPMVYQARRQTWPVWSTRSANRAASAAEAIAAGRYSHALETMQRMRDDLDARMRTAADLCETTR
jgi:hypothetical protein